MSSKKDTKRLSHHSFEIPEEFREVQEPVLDDAAWFDLVDRLGELSPVDFEAAVQAVRLCRRLVEDDRRRGLETKKPSVIVQRRENLQARLKEANKHRKPPTAEELDYLRRQQEENEKAMDAYERELSRTASERR